MNERRPCAPEIVIAEAMLAKLAVLAINPVEGVCDVEGIVIPPLVPGGAPI